MFALHSSVQQGADEAEGQVPSVRLCCAWGVSRHQHQACRMAPVPTGWMCLAGSWLSKWFAS